MLLISRSDSPHIRCAPRPGLARGRIARPIWMHTIQGPAELARDSIKAANDARGRPAILAVKDLIPCTKETQEIGRWRVDRHIARGHTTHHTRGIDLTI